MDASIATAAALFSKSPIKDTYRARAVREWAESSWLSTCIPTAISCIYLITLKIIMLVGPMLYGRTI